MHAFVSMDISYWLLPCAMCHAWMGSGPLPSLRGGLVLTCTGFFPERHLEVKTPALLFLGLHCTAYS